jgi:hypothetical protein
MRGICCSSFESDSCCLRLHDRASSPMSVTLVQEACSIKVTAASRPASKLALSSDCSSGQQAANKRPGICAGYSE